VWASFKAREQKTSSATTLGGFDETGSNVTIDESMTRFLGKEIIPQILDAGFNFDFIDADAIDQIGIPYKILILPGVERMPPETYAKIAEFARRGGTVIATRRLPDVAPGYRDAAMISARVKQTSDSLFQGQIGTAHFVADEQSLGTTLQACLSPDFVAKPATPQIGFIHRHLESGDLYFVANTGNMPRSIEASFRAGGSHGEMWDPFTGATSGIPDSRPVELKLEAYESRLIFFSNRPLSPAVVSSGEKSERVDISHDWQVTVGSSRFNMADLTSWTDNAGLRFYSGTAVYEKTVELSGTALGPGKSQILDFGKGTPVPLPDPLPDFNMRAYLESPVREAAQVYVNDRFAGYVWHPPFQVEITGLLTAGENKIRIIAGNTAINELAGTVLPDYRLLYSRYGVEFVPQDMQNLQPLPSGMMGPLTLIERNERTQDPR
jgi:hypothetical protein